MQFKDIEGQIVLSNRLTQIIDSGRVSHAQIFVGESRSGALQLALAYAQYVNCEHRAHFQVSNPNTQLVADSCGLCPSCQKYRQLSHPDLHLFFPNATTTKVTNKPSSMDFQLEFRQFLSEHGQRGTLEDWYHFMAIENKQGLIREKDSSDILRVVGMKPYEKGPKVIVIWMAEKMNLSCANTLLKSLEEPTGDTLILLVAEKTEQMLSTILSRVQEIRVPSDKDAALLRFSPQQRLDYARDFVGWMRMLFKLNMSQLSQWVDNISVTGREQQKLFLSFAQEAVRRCIHSSMAGLPLPIDFGDQKFNASFPNMITFRNAEGILNAIDEASFSIGRNANPKITFMVLSFNISKWLKKR